MGQETSKERAYSKLQRVRIPKGGTLFEISCAYTFQTIPGTEDFRYVENGKSKSEKLFGNDQDRDQFISTHNIHL